MKALIILLGLTFTVLGCSTKLVQTSTSSVPAHSSKEKVANAIKAGGAERGWVAKPISDGTMELTLQERSHRVVVMVLYSSTEYTVNYKDSTNMKYDPAAGTIHKKYNKWVTLLKQSIDRKLY